MKIKRLAIISMLICIACILGYVESVIPISIGIPGVKLGIANVVTLIALYKYGFSDGFIIGIMRVLIVGILFTNFSVIVYSLSGFIVSYTFMYIFKRMNVFSVIGVSVLGGVVHNLTQLAVAIIITDVGELVFYGIILIVSGTIAGLFIGILSNIIIPKITHFYD